MNHTRADADKEGFQKICEYFTYRAEMLRSLDEELRGRQSQAADNASRSQSMGHGDNVIASEETGSMEQ